MFSKLSIQSLNRDSINCHECILPQFKDLLQLMIEASVQEDSGRSSTNTMDDAEIAGHSFVFMMAGYDTTANALTYVSYLLALHPDIQKDLQAEIDGYYENNPVSVSRKRHGIAFIFNYCIGCFSLPSLH